MWNGSETSGTPPLTAELADSELADRPGSMLLHRAHEPVVGPVGGGTTVGARG